jgi:hypothetical protein
VEYGKLEKRISFMDTDKRNADLIVRLKHDSLTKTKFFRAILTGYLENDPLIREFIEAIKEENAYQSRKKSKINKEMIDEGINNVRKIGLNDKEIENIFDMLEKEHPDL